MHVRIMATAVAVLLGLTCTPEHELSPSEPKAHEPTAQQSQSLSISDEQLLVPPAEATSPSDPPLPAAGPALHCNLAAGQLDGAPMALAVWRHYQANSDRYDIHGGRLDADGNLLDLGGLRIGEDSRLSCPRTAYNAGAGAFLTVWLSAATTLRLARTAADGTPIDPAEGTKLRVLSTAVDLDATTVQDVASNNAIWMVIYEDLDPQSQQAATFVQRIQGDATLGPRWSLGIRANEVAIAWQPQWQRFVVVYRNKNQAFARLIDPDTGPNANALLLGTAKIGGVAVAGSATLAHATWTTAATCSSEVRGRWLELGLMGQLTLSGPLYTHGTCPGAQSFLQFDSPTTYVDGDLTAVSYRRRKVVPGFGGALNSTNELGIQLNIGLSSQGIWADDLTPTSESGHRLVRLKDQLVYAFNEHQGKKVLYRSYDIYQKLVGAKKTLSTRLANQQQLALSDGPNALALWVSDRAGLGSTQVRGRRLDANGQGLGPLLDIGSGSAMETAPAVATGPTASLVAWLESAPETGSTLVVRSLRQGDQLGPPQLVADATPASERPFGPPQVIADGMDPDGSERYLLLYTRGVVGERSLHARSAQITSSGEISLADERLLAAAVPGVGRSHPTVATWQSGKLIVWAEYENSDWNIKGIEVDANGNASEAFDVCAHPGSQTAPSVAITGERALVVWNDSRNLGNNLRGAILLPGGERLPEAEDFLIDTSSAEAHDVAVSRQGSNFLVAWQGSPDGGLADVFGRWIDLDGKRLGAQTIPLSTEAVAERAPTLARLSDGQLLLGYSRFAPPTRTSLRVTSRIILSGNDDGTACTQAEDCSSRLCEQGICCDRPCNGICESCTLTAGTCTPVKNATDDSCFGGFACDGEGICKKAQGESCQVDTECSSGFCSQGSCCDRRCDGTCESCSIERGSCILQDCSGYSCDAARACLLACQDSRDCAPGYQCFSDGQCQRPLAAPAPSSGCSLAVTSTKSLGSPRTWSLLGLLAMALLRRRRSCPRATKPALKAAAANGSPWRLRATAAATMLRLLGLFLLVLFGCSDPQRTSPPSPSERSAETQAAWTAGAANTPIGRPDAYNQTSTAQQSPARLASDGKRAVAVWRSRRLDGSDRLLAIPMDSEGRAQGPARSISDDVKAAEFDIVYVAETQRYVVAWLGPAGEVFAQQWDGLSLKPAAAPVQLGKTLDDSNVNLASDGSHALAVWQQTEWEQGQPTTRVQAARMASDNSYQNLALGGFEALASQRLVRAVFAQGYWLVAWLQHGGTIWTQTLLPDLSAAVGAPQEATSSRIGNASYNRKFALSSNGQTTYLAWHTTTPTKQTPLLLYRLQLDPAGTPTWTPSVKELLLNFPPPSEGDSIQVLVSDQVSTVVQQMTGIFTARTIRATIFSPKLKYGFKHINLDDTSTGDVWLASVHAENAANDEERILATLNHNGGAGELYAHRIFPTQSAKQPIAKAATHQQSAALAQSLTAGSHSIVWQESPAPNVWHLRTARVDATGTFLGPGLALGPSAKISSQLPPAVLDQGKSQLVVWLEGTQLRSRALGGNATLGETTDLGALSTLAPGTIEPAWKPGGLSIAAAPGGALVLASANERCPDCQAGERGRSAVLVLRLDHQGRLVADADVLDSGSLATEGAAEPRLVWDPIQQRHWAVWTTSSVFTPGRTRLRLAERPWSETSLGAWLDRSAGLPNVADTDKSSQDQPFLVLPGSETSLQAPLVVWRERRFGGQRIRGSFANESDPPCPSEGIVISEGAGAFPVAVDSRDGHTLLVAWQGSPNGSPDKIYGAWLKPSCELLDASNALLADSEGPAANPSVIRTAPGRLLLSYTHHQPMPVGSPRLEVRTLRSGTLDGADCDTNDDCASRRCIDGVCCNSPCGSCERCASGSGLCEAVTDSEDDSCNGTTRCDGDGLCLRAEGEICTAASDCASGYCVDGVCCNRSCNGTCERCDTAPTVGLCTSLDCGGYSCDEERRCKSSCQSSYDCANGLQCEEGGACVNPRSPPAANSSCGIQGPSRGSDDGPPVEWLLYLVVAFATRRRQKVLRS